MNIGEEISLQGLRVPIVLISILLSFGNPSETLAADVSFTIDDPGVQNTLNMDHIQVGKQILKTLSENQLKTTLFVCGKRVDNIEGQNLLSLWDKEDHIIANHTYSHENYNSDKITFQFFTNDIIKNEKLIQNFKNFRRFFRYPMLKEGNTEIKRDSLHAFLKQRNYSLGYVTIDASDWYISDRLVKKMNQGAKVDFDAFKKYYLNHIWDRAQYYNNLSKKFLVREIKHFEIELRYPDEDGDSRLYYKQKDQLTGIRKNKLPSKVQLNY
jgi:hypothetical protein